ncbi:MAG: M14 family zinc carboxypeptidase [candidate division WOR-3 bacterium]
MRCIALIIPVIMCNSILKAEQLKVVRVNVKSYAELEGLLLRTFGPDEMPEIAAGMPGEWYDLIMRDAQVCKLKGKEISFQVIVEDLEAEKEKVKDGYHSYDQVVQILRSLAQSYSQLARIESIGPTYEGRYIYGIKISDNVHLDEDEPEHLISGCTHAREWVSVEVPLFIADSILRAYGRDGYITNLVNNREIWIFPVLNVDGYVYDYSGGGTSWRKNREPYSNSIGTDLNRNFNGTCDSTAQDGWGYINGTSTSHNPGQDVFCGKYGNSAPEVAAYTNFIKSRNFVTILDYHTYSELVLVPWGHKRTPTPHENLYNEIGQGMASRIQKLNGGNYTFQKSIDLYPTSGSSSDWEYGWSIYVAGKPCIAICVEMGTAFYQNTSDLPHIKRENFEGAIYLIDKGDYILNTMKTPVPAPIIVEPSIDTVRAESLVVKWSVPNSRFCQIDSFTVELLKDESVIVDGFENGTANWVLEGFSRSSSRYYAGSYSLASPSQSYVAAQARTKYPYIVKPGDSLKYWTYYDIQRNADAAIVEISENLREWFSLLPERLSGQSGGWVQHKIDLSPYIGKSVFFRFRYMTDFFWTNAGLFVDNVYPVVSYDLAYRFRVTSDTFIVIRNLPEGIYFVRVTGYSPTFGKGNSSLLRKIYYSPTSVSVRDVDAEATFVLKTSRNIITENPVFWVKGDAVSIKVFDSQGRPCFTYSGQKVNGDVRCTLRGKGVFFYIGKVDGKEYKGSFVKVR